MPNLITNHCELCLMPLSFQSISFHHRAFYRIRLNFTIKQKNKNTSILPFIISPKYLIKKQVIIDRDGNIQNIEGKVNVQRKYYQTAKFLIQYNDQSAMFRNALVYKFNLSKTKGEFKDKKEQEQDSQIGILSIQLFKQPQGNSKKQQQDHYFNHRLQLVSSQTMIINLKEIRTNKSSYQFRKILFSDNQYISSLVLGYFPYFRGGFINIKALTTKTNPIYTKKQSHKNAGCCSVSNKNLAKKISLSQAYHQLIELKIKIYDNLRGKLMKQIQKYKRIIKVQKTKNKIRIQYTNFQNQLIKKQVIDLRYALLQDFSDEAENNFGTDSSLKKTLNLDQFQPKRINQLLGERYECSEQAILYNIFEQSQLIERNISALFYRYIQVSFLTNLEIDKQLIKQEVKRVEDFVNLGKQNILSNRKNIRLAQISKQAFRKYLYRANKLLKSCSNYTFLQKRQPLVNDFTTISSLVKEKSDDFSNNQILTILVHGYKGNEYDLSKMKSYLTLYLNLTNFLSIKNMNMNQNSDYSIGQLGEIASKQIIRYLSINDYIRYINFVGFSLGGVIIRAMLPYLKQYKSKLNLFVTFATPHLGINQIGSCLVKTGLFYMRRVAGVSTIKQLFTQKVGNEASLIELAEQQLIQSFKMVIFAGSHEDEYVPLYSSIAEYGGDNEQIQKMNLQFNSRLKNIIKCIVRFDCDESVWDIVTRRRNHISFLEDDAFIRYFIVKYRQYFYP